MRETWKRFKTFAIVVSCCMLALGLLMVIYPRVSALTVCVLLGILCLVAGGYSLVRYFRLGVFGAFFRFDLTFGICCIIVGVLFLAHPNGAAALMPIALGIYLLIAGVTDIQLSAELRGLGGGWVLSLILSILDVIAALLLLFNPFEGVSAVMIFAGASLIISGIQGLYTVICITKSLKDDIKFVEGKWTPVE